MRIEWTAEAVAELDAILAHIAKQDMSIATQLTERVLHAEDSVLTLPRAARHDTETDTYDRYIPKTRIVLTYAIRDDVIWVITVWHTSRDPQTKPKRSI